MRVVSANLDNIRAAAERGFFAWVADQDIDLLCLQNVQAYEYELDSAEFCPAGYERYFFEAWEPGVGGVAIYTRHQPKAVIRGLGFELADQNGCYIQVDFDKVSIASLLVAGSEGTGNDQNQKYKFLNDYLAYLGKQNRKRREFIICGGWQMAHNKVDLADWREATELPGFTPPERAWLDEVLGSMGFVDAYREVDREGGKYSWWQTDNDRENDKGARMDYQLVTPGMRHTVLSGGIYTGQTFGRHAPVIIDYDWELSI
ncbi:exodeoxyribonuclease III [Aestuariirhabdus sp. Z084]|uniref:exodeoxyribonuclease III n=1 Tax=Aestuariirhabdus haliotis TaxID=2918751 RepID=UPI00201B402A|nr:exodeoxyribonuclease III [Aestuariirhabdus haliotis]MCL6414303.1 exodeoxyribonuclease III [Aestuariirhabdus haliotis]MCL6418235.1 exodeoxyribonuclease III [Aestuariirhabdus haliotis]